MCRWYARVPRPPLVINPRPPPKSLSIPHFLPCISLSCTNHLTLLANFLQHSFFFSSTEFYFYYQSGFVVVDVVVALPKRCSICRVSFVLLLLLLLFYQEGARFSHFPCLCCSSSIKKVLDFLIFLFLVLLPKSCSIFPFSLLLLYQKGARFFHFFFFFLYRQGGRK